MPSNKKPTIIGVPWNFATVWNKTLDATQDRPLVARSHIWASELGLAYCDRYLKMNAVPYTNPPNERSKRKFQAGNMWEWVVGMVFLAAGLIKKKQIRAEVELKGLLRVTGKIDYVIGGAFDYDAAKKKITEIKEALQLLDIELPPFFFTAIDNFVEQNKGKILREEITEIKAISSYMMEKVKKTGAMSHQILQTAHYVYGNDIKLDTGKIIYLCKDDCIMEEFNLCATKDIMKYYKQDVEQMTKHYHKGFHKQDPMSLMPPVEKQVEFEPGVWRFTKNFRVEYSPYLKMLYGYETPEAFRMAWQYKTASWNRVFKRCVRGDNMTPKNKIVIEEASKAFPEWDKYVKLAKKDNAFAKPETEEDDE